MPKKKREGQTEETLNAPDNSAPESEQAAQPKPKEAAKENPRVKELETLLAETNGQLLRLAAEYDNYKKRTQREKDELYTSSKADILSMLLPVFDNFERAENNKEAGFEDYKKGVGMIFGQLSEILAKIGLEPFGQKGDNFDPNIHNAVMHSQDETLPENTVVEVFYKGYKIGDRVIRPATVSVVN